MNFQQTALTSIDSYKLGHAEQYPVGTTKVYSNFTARSSKNFKHGTESIVWFGLQAVLEEMNALWKETFFDQPIDKVTTEFAELVAPFCGPKGFDVSRLKQLHKLGHLPLHIKALPEGSVVKIGVPVLTITNTTPETYWLPNFLETYMSAELWKISTSATISYAYRKVIDKYAELTGGNKEFVSWQGHDFSPRGMSGIKDAAKSGAGHLLSFTGSDNIPALKLVNDVYNGKSTFVSGSVPATEHSVMCAGGKESEIETFRRLIKTYPSGILSIVSDTWDYWNVITKMATELKEDILARTPDEFGNAKIVFRPDSGDPVKILTGYDIVGVFPSDEDCYKYEYKIHGLVNEFSAVKIGNKYFKVGRYDSSRIGIGEELSEAEVKGSVATLADIFGVTVNDKEYKTLNPRVGLIYGDSITLERTEAILSRLAAKGFASDNVVFGIGSYTFQYTTRDTFGFAMKATYVEIDGKGSAIFKEPKTDDGTKKSARGLLKVIGSSGGYSLVNDCSALEEQEGVLQTVFLNGRIVSAVTFEEARKKLGMI